MLEDDEGAIVPPGGPRAPHVRVEQVALRCLEESVELGPLRIDAEAVFVVETGRPR